MLFQAKTFYLESYKWEEIICNKIILYFLLLTISEKLAFSLYGIHSMLFKWQKGLLSQEKRKVKSSRENCVSWLGDSEPSETLWQISFCKWKLTLCIQNPSNCDYKSTLLPYQVAIWGLFKKWGFFYRVIFKRLILLQSKESL
jgi:hypothetical protein